MAFFIRKELHISYQQEESNSSRETEAQQVQNVPEVVDTNAHFPSEQRISP